MPMVHGQTPTDFSNHHSGDMGGLSRMIYDILSPDFVVPVVEQINGMDESVMQPDQKTEAKMKTIKFYKMLAYAVAKAVVEHLKSNLTVKVQGVVCKVNIGGSRYDAIQEGSVNGIIS